MVAQELTKYVGMFNMWHKIAKYLMATVIFKKVNVVHSSNNDTT